MQLFVASLERQCWKNAQYLRSECIEISEIDMPNWIMHKELQKTVWKVLKHIGAGIC